MNTYEIFYNQVHNKDEHFINRTEIREKLLETYRLFNVDNSNLFEIYSIYGFGGMGKTHLLKFLNAKFTETLPKNLLIYISFEIQENSQMLYGLMKLRKAFGHSCPIFDYAVLCYWDREHIERLNDDFAKLLKNDILYSFGDLILNFVLPSNFPMPSFGDLHAIINDGTRKWKNAKIRNELQTIQDMDSIDILDSLPYFLAEDIKAYMQQSNTNFIFIIDSYQQSRPYSESAEWLFTFINTLQKGFFIITGREELLWDPINYVIHQLRLESYPPDEAREFLKKRISISRMDIIDTIIQSTDCIPIYIALALDVYEKEQNISTDCLISKSKFKDRNMLVKHFINHLNQNWQNMILTLAVIRIFNNRIFDFLIDDLNLPCSKMDFDDIVQISLLSYTECTDELYKIHDVFCENAITVLKNNSKAKVFRSYLKFLAKREIYSQLVMGQVSSAVTLLKNIINIEINLNPSLSLGVKDFEATIDIFFMVSSTRATIVLPKPAEKYNSEINDLLYLMNAVLYEKENTFKTVKRLNNIKNPKNFGKHFISYNILLKYALALRGDYTQLKNYLETLESAFCDSDKMEWYYLKTYIYLIDYYIMEGKFKKAYSYIAGKEELISGDIYDIDNFFLIKRLEGHMWRFNYQFDKAAKTYQLLMDQYEDIQSLKVYLLTNMCETKCFVDPQYVIDHFHEALAYTKQFHNMKNEAKLYYSRGIAYTLMQNYKQAIRDIEKSIQINKNDGYKSGALFAYMAKVFYEYATKGDITKRTYEKIKALISKIKVYDFLLYPIYLIKDELDKVPVVDWIDRDVTTIQCEQFLNQLNPNRHL